MSEHQMLYKNSRLNGREFLRQRRQEVKIDLRRQKRDEVLSKKRSLDPSLTRNEINSDDELPSPVVDDVDDISDPPFSITKELIDAINQNNDQILIVENAQKIRKLLSKDPQPPFNLIISSGLMPRFVELLDWSDVPTLQFEVAWILTNICSGTSEQTKVVVDHGAVPKLVGLMSSTDLKVCEQATWALGNIIGDGPEFRDMVINYGFLPALLNLIRPELDINFLINITWVLVNIVRCKEPPPSLEIIKQIIPALTFLIQHNDFAILLDTTWAITYITELGPTHAQLIVESKLIDRVSPLLSYHDYRIQTAAIRALGAIVMGDDKQSQAVIDAGVLPLLNKLLHDDKERTVKEALWVLSNISAGSAAQIQAVIDSQIMPLVVYHMSCNNFTVSEEAAWVIYNISLSGTKEQLEVIVNLEVPAILCKLINFLDNRLTRRSLEALTSILSQCGERQSEIVESIEKSGGLDILETLHSQMGENDELVNILLETYFNQDGMADDYEYGSQ